MQLGYEGESSAVDDDVVPEMRRRRRSKGRCIEKRESKVAYIFEFMFEVNWFLEG